MGRQFKKKSSTKNIGPIMKLAILTIGTILLVFYSNKVGAMDTSNFSKNCSPKVTNHLSMVFFLLTKSNLKVLDEEYDYSTFDYEQVDPFLGYDEKTFQGLLQGVDTKSDCFQMCLEDIKYQGDSDMNSILLKCIKEELCKGEDDCIYYENKWKNSSKFEDVSKDLKKVVKKLNKCLKNSV